MASALAAATAAAPAAAQTDTVTVYAAGSLRRALTTIAADFERAAPGRK